MDTRIGELIFKQIKGEITPEERAELDRFAAESEANRHLLNNLTRSDYLLEELKQSHDWKTKERWQEIRAGSRSPLEHNKNAKSGLRNIRVPLLRYVAISAAALVILAIGIYLYSNNNNAQPEKQTKHVDQERDSSSIYFKASLKRSNGDSLQLSELNPLIFKPAIFEPTRVQFENLNELPHFPGLIISPPPMNTLETFNQNYYRMQLPDGSKVWLNCSSSIQFPDNFASNERVVYLEGEAYFDIVRDTSRPFRVVAPGAEIIVTGTKFNLNAYKEDGILRTTLLEGSIKLKVRNRVTSLKEGEQALLNHSGEIKKTKNIKAEQALAWQQNQFDWNYETLETVIADVCHWYGLEPVYKERISIYSYSATLNRSRPLKEILAILEVNMPIKFKLEGKKLYIQRAQNPE